MRPSGLEHEATCFVNGLHPEVCHDPTWAALRCFRAGRMTRHSNRIVAKGFEMNKLVKGAVAGAVGVTLLLGGAGTFALWNSTIGVSTGSISTGNLAFGTAT